MPTDGLTAWLDTLLGAAAEAVEREGDIAPASMAVPPPLPAAVLALSNALGVRDGDLEPIALALAPDLDARFARLVAHLQDESGAVRPSLELAEALFGPRTAERIDRLSSLRLVTLTDAAFRGGARLVPDPHLRSLLHGLRGLHPALEGSCRLVHRAADAAPRGIGVEALAAAARTGPVRVWFTGGRAERAEAIAASVAAELGSPLLTADLGAALAAEPSLTGFAPALVREAWLRDAAIFLRSADRLFVDGAPGAPGNLAAALASDGGVCILHGESDTPLGTLEHRESPLAVVVRALPPTTPAEREEALAAAAGEYGLELDRAELAALAGRFRLDPDELRGAAARAAAALRLGFHDGPARALADGARRARGHRLATVAVRVEPRATWDDLLLPDDVLRQLGELVDLVTQRDSVWDAGGFGSSTARGRGVSVLFGGASGTGKTTAAEVIAGELGFDLYRIDLAGVVSKYIGETEKNLDRVFAAAEGANAILLFDEADALFGKRSEVSDAHDRYANVEIAYLLQRIEAYDGVAILTTNLRHHLDEAFLRRLTATITFPIPDEDGRRRLWGRAWPEATAVDEGLDRAALAARYRLSGGGVRNVALYAAHLAAAEDEPVGAGHVSRALRREYQKLGVPLEEVPA